MLKAQKGEVHNKEEKKTVPKEKIKIRKKIKWQWNFAKRRK
jgi:hypothetical protein